MIAWSPFAARGVCRVGKGKNLESHARSNEASKVLEHCAFLVSGEALLR